MKNQKYKIEMVILTTLITAFLVVGCSKENSDWKTTKYTNTEEAYQSFVAKYPNGKHSTDAVDAAENLAWKDTQSKNTEEAYHSFITKYPDGKHNSDALGAVEKLTWESARKSNTVASIESFIESYPRSSYLTEAQQMLYKLTSIPMTKDYREMCLQWAKEFLYKGKSESEIYTDVKKRHMHYAYTGFLEMFPNTTHRPEIENLMQGFRLYTSPGNKDTILTFSYLKEKLNYNGVDSVYRWNNVFSGFFGPNDSYIFLDTRLDGPDVGVKFQNALGWDWIGPILCFGNLQVLVGTFTPMKNGEIGINAKIIYPTTKP
jgi:outer membrane protein assembly factor BamD (BamD/ComL family)